MRKRLIRALGTPIVASLSVGMAAWPAAAVPARLEGPARAALQPWPVTITIRTVPALPGVRFLFDGEALVTGPQGATFFTEQHNFSAHTLSLTQTQVEFPGRRYTFVRWAGQRDPNQAFRPMVHGLPMRADYTITASFAIACRVSPRLVEQDGAALPARQVSRITLRNSLGQVTAMRPSGTTWLPCAWPVYRDSLLSSRDIWYTVQSMLVGGGNVVHAGVARFMPSQTPHPKLTGFFYTLTITAHDALLGGAMGSYALLTMPDRTVRRVELGSEHTATVSNLPTGTYRVQVKAGSASISPQTVRLSRDETANPAAVSVTDTAVICGALVAGLALVPLLSRTRRRRLRVLARRSRGLVRSGRREPGEETS